MREVIQKVIAAEAEAKHIREAAHTEAERILAEARQRALETTEAARKEARLAAEQRLEAGDREALAQKTDRLARATAEIETHVRLDDSERQRAAEAAVRCVCGLP